MGTYNVYCSISKLPILEYEQCYLLPLVDTLTEYPSQDTHNLERYFPSMLPILGTYNCYGSLIDIVENDNTRLIEQYFNTPIQTITHILSQCEEGCSLSVKKNGEEIKRYNFCWINKDIFDFLNTFKNVKSLLYYACKPFEWRNLKQELKFEKLFDWLAGIYTSDMRKLLSGDIEQRIICEYAKDLDCYGERLAELYNMYLNMLEMNVNFSPYIMYLPVHAHFDVTQPIFEKIYQIQTQKFLKYKSDNR